MELKVSKEHLLLICILLTEAKLVLSVATVRLTQETPCFVGQSCRLRCTAVSGEVDRGLIVSAGSTAIVRCTSRTSCFANFNSYTLTTEGITTSIVDIKAFSSEVDERDWTCVDAPLGEISTLPLSRNVLPSGPLTFGNTCGSGRATSPASLSCSLPNAGSPAATFTLRDSSSQTVGSSETVRVTWTVTRGGQASCSVTWSAFPSFPLNISSALCDVQVIPTAMSVGNNNLIVRDGRSVTVSCEAWGSPVPTVTWSRYGQVNMTYRNSTLTRESLTFTANRSEGDIQMVACTALNAAGLHSTNFTLNVQYPPPGQPVIQGLAAGLEATDGQDLSLSCEVSGGNPPVSSVTLTCPRHNKTSQDDVTRLEFTAGRGDQGSCVCSASHVLGYSLTASLSLVVRFAPSITITASNGIGQSKVIRCQAQGYPDTYTFQPWIQSWGGQEVRRVTGSQQGGQYSLTLTSYQDSGTYTCSVDNGIPSRNGELVVSSSAFVELEDAPQLLPSPVPAVIYAELDDLIQLEHRLYSVPALSNYSWYLGTQRNNKSTSELTVTNSSVSLPVHQVYVEARGFIITANVTFSNDAEGTYHFLVCNRIACTSFVSAVKPAGSPNPAEDLQGSLKPNGVLLSWTPGFAGGNFFQWFHVQYTRQDSQEGQWSDVSTADNRSSSDRTPVTVTVQGLQPDTSYVFRVRAQSSRSQQNLSNYTFIVVKTEGMGNSQAAIVGGSVAGGVLVLTVFGLGLAVLLRRRNGKTQKENNYSDLNLASRATLRDQATYEQLQERQAQTESHIPSEAEEGNRYSGLQLSSRAVPRDSAAYQTLGDQSGSRVLQSGNEENYSVLDPTLRPMPSDGNPYQAFAVYENPCLRDDSDSRTANTNTSQT